jgi:hypothetical protein
MRDIRSRMQLRRVMMAFCGRERYFEIESHLFGTGLAQRYSMMRQTWILLRSEIERRIYKFPKPTTTIIVHQGSEEEDLLMFVEDVSTMRNYITSMLYNYLKVPTAVSFHEDTVAQKCKQSPYKNTRYYQITFKDRPRIIRYINADAYVEWVV